MFTVTLPSGKVYTYGPAKRAAAYALAAKTGGTVVETGRRTRVDDDGYDAIRDAALMAGGTYAARAVRWG